MDEKLNNWIVGLTLVERLMAMAMNIGARVRAKIEAGEPVTDEELDAHEAEVRAQIAEARTQVKAKMDAEAALTDDGG